MDNEALCARCSTRLDPDASTVRFECNGCQTLKAVWEFNPVTIREWKTGKRGKDAPWMCFECLHPECGMCGKRPEYAVVHNSKMKEADYFRHAQTDTERTLMRKKLEEGTRPDKKPPDTLRRFACNEAVYFCETCKYPPCASGIAGDTSAVSRSLKTGSIRKQRFLIWTCPVCKQEEENIKHLEAVVKKLNGKLPSHHHADKDIQKAGIYVKNQRAKYQEGKLSLQLQEKLAQLPNWSWDDRKKNKENSQWDEGLANLRQCMAKNGNKIPSRKSSSASDKRASIFAMHRKTEYKKDTLKADKVTALEEIDGWKW